jgi:50S ribosomal protein L16 3-hydroxylase
VSPLFDAYVNFLWQLLGKKNWALLENDSAERPLEHYALNELPFVPAELSSYWKNNPPLNYFERSKDVTVEPGDMLFVPRGVWHATKTIEESFSVHFTFSIPSWMEVVLERLRLKLAGKRDLRALASDDITTKTVALDILKDALASMKAEELFELQDAQYDKYQIAGAVFRQVLQLEASA